MITPYVDELDIYDFAVMVEAYIFDILVSKKVSIKEIVKKELFAYELYKQKYEESQDGVSIDAYTESDEQHYKIWCVENGYFSKETWYKLMMVSLEEEYQKLLNELIVLE